MQKILGSVITVLFLFLSSAAFASDAEDYSNTINTFRESAALEKFFNDSYGYAVFPIIGRAGFMVGGSYGTGQVYKAGVVTGKSTVIEGSIGFQIGGKVFSQIIFFQDERAYADFTSGNFEFGANAHVVAITAGAGAQAGTAGSTAVASAGPSTAVQAESEYHRGMATFVHAKGGLMSEFTVSGQKFTFEAL